MGCPRALTAPSPCLATLQALATCRTAQIVTQYCVGANYTWLLVEGIYLHSLLVLVGGSEGGHFRGYLLFGWGAGSGTKSSPSGGSYAPRSS